MTEKTVYVKYNDLIVNGEPCIGFSCDDCLFHNANGIIGCYMTRWFSKLPKYTIEIQETK